MVTIGNMRVGYAEAMDLDDPTEFERDHVYETMQTIWEHGRNQVQFPKMRQLFAELRKWNLTEGEQGELAMAARCMPLAEMPVYLPSRSQASLLETTYGFNVEAMNRDEFKLFALGVIDGSIAPKGRARGKYLTTLLDFLALDLFSREDAWTFLAKIIKIMATRLEETTPPVGVDEDQQFLVTCVGLLDSATDDSFEILMDVVAHCLRNDLYGKQNGAVTPASWRFRPVLIAAFDGLYKLFETEHGPHLWMEAQSDLCWWKAELIAGKADVETMDSFSMLLPLDT